MKARTGGGRREDTCNNCLSRTWNLVDQTLLILAHQTHKTQTCPGSGKVLQMVGEQKHKSFNNTVRYCRVEYTQSWLIVTPLQWKSTARHTPYPREIPTPLSSWQAKRATFLPLAKSKRQSRRCDPFCRHHVLSISLSSSPPSVVVNFATSLPRKIPTPTLSPTPLLSPSARGGVSITLSLPPPFHLSRLLPRGSGGHFPPLPRPSFLSLTRAVTSFFSARCEPLTTLVPRQQHIPASIASNFPIRCSHTYFKHSSKNVIPHVQFSSTMHPKNVFPH